MRKVHFNDDAISILSVLSRAACKVRKFALLLGEEKITSE
jgi:hypothetical protein